MYCKFKSLFLTCAAVVCLSSPTIEATAVYNNLTDTGTSAKMVGIGYVMGFDSSAVAIFENPASLYDLKKMSLTAFYTTFLGGESKYLNYAFAYRLPFNVVFGFGLMDSQVSDIKQTGATSASDPSTYFVSNTFDYRNSMYKAAVQWDLLPNIHTGVSLSYFKHDLFTVTGTGFNADIGVVANIQAVDISLLAKNVIPGNFIKYTNDTEEKVQSQYIAGIHYNVADFDLYGQLKYQSQKYISAGVRYHVVPFISVSGGWSEFSVLGELKNKISLGVNLDVSKLGVNFAFEKSDYFESDNQFYTSFQIDF